MVKDNILSLSVFLRQLGSYIEHSWCVLVDIPCHKLKILLPSGTLLQL